MMMTFCVFQKQKELFSADFDILGKTTYGTIHFQGKLGSVECTCQGTFDQNYFHLHKCFFSPKGIKAFRTYQIEINGEKTGYVYQTKSKKEKPQDYTFFQMIYNGLVFNRYPLYFGEEGSRDPVYLGEKQIAQIERDCAVENDLYEYKVYAENEEASLISVLFCCYMYICGGFKPGEKVSSSFEKKFSTTTNEALLEKYNPYFHLKEE